MKADIPITTRRLFAANAAGGIVRARTPSGGP